MDVLNMLQNLCLVKKKKKVKFFYIPKYVYMFAEQIIEKMKVLGNVLFLIGISLSGVIAAVFEKAPHHEGIIIQAQDTIFSTDDFIRIRMDISLEGWREHDQVLQSQVNSTKEWVKTVARSEVQTFVQRLIDVSNAVDVDTWILPLRQRKQVLLGLMPNEEIDDPVIVSSHGYVQDKRTYYMDSPCSTPAGLVSRDANLSLWELLIDILKSGIPTRSEVLKSSLKARDSLTTSSQATSTTTTIRSLSTTMGSNPSTSTTARSLTKRDEVRAAIAALTNLLQYEQIAISDTAKLIATISEGKFMEDCISTQQWETMVTAIAPQLTDEQQEGYREEVISYLIRFPLTLFKLSPKKDSSVIRTLFLIPAPNSLAISFLRTLKYVPIRKKGKRLMLRDQPEKIMSDARQEWISGQEALELLEERCLPSWTTPTQKWCFGGLDMQTSQQWRCVLDALPADNFHPDPSCYIEEEARDTQIMTLPTGNLFVSPVQNQVVAIQCKDKTFQKTISEDTKVTLPRGCSGIIGQHRISANPLSDILEPPKEWRTKASKSDANELLPYDSGNEEGPIISFIDDDWPEQALPVSSTIAPTIPHWIEASKNWAIEVVGKPGVQIGLMVGIAILVLYCCCAPANWPRLNGAAWIIQALGRGMMAMFNHLSSWYRSTCRARQARPHRRIRQQYRGEVFRDPLERAMMLSRL